MTVREPNFEMFDALPVAVAKSFAAQATEIVSRNVENFATGSLLRGFVKSEDAADAMVFAVEHVFADLAEDYLSTHETVESAGLSPALKRLVAEGKAWPTGVRRSVPLNDDPEELNDHEAPRGTTIED